MHPRKMGSDGEIEGQNNSRTEGKGLFAEGKRGNGPPAAGIPDKIDIV